MCATQVFEESGESKVEEASATTLVCGLMVIQELDLTAPEAEPIVKMLREIPSTLRFVLDHNLVFMKALGFTTSAVCAVSRLHFEIRFSWMQECFRANH